MINWVLAPSLTTTESLRLEKSKGTSSTFVYLVESSSNPCSDPRVITASSILLRNPVWKYAFKKACFKTLKSSFPITSRYFSRTILSSVNVPVLSVHKMFIAPKLWIESSFFTMVFFLDIRRAPFDKLVDKITGSRSGVIHIAIATAKVNDTIISCFQTFSKNTIGINTNMNFISNLLIFSIPFWNAVLGLPVVKVCATFPKYVLSAVKTTTPFAEPLITFVPMKQIVSISERLSISCSDGSSVFSIFLIASDSPVRVDWPTYKSLDSIILMSAGIMSPAESKTVSPKTKSLKATFIFLPFLITVAVVDTSCFNASAAKFERYSEKKSKNVLIATNVRITIIFA